MTKESKDIIKEKQKATEFSDDDLLKTIAGMKLKGVKAKLKAEANESSIMGAEKFYSSDTMNLLNTSGRKSFLGSETELSINFSFLNNRPKKPKGRSFSSGSLANIIKDFQDQDSNVILKNMIKSDKEINVNDLSCKDKKNLFKNLNTLNALNVHDDSINSIDCENLKNNLLKSEDKILSLDHSLTLESNPGSKKKENFIPKSELIKDGAGGVQLGNFNQINLNNIGNKNLNVNEKLPGNMNLNLNLNAKPMGGVINNPMLN
jgi:hypothetical protein